MWVGVTVQFITWYLFLWKRVQGGGPDREAEQDAVHAALTGLSAAAQEDEETAWGERDVEGVTKNSNL